MMSDPGASPIYLLRGPVHTGKTTRLLKWCAALGAPVNTGLSPAASDTLPTPAGLTEALPPIDGILAPVIDGRRHLLHIASGEMRDLEDLSGGAAVVRVRRYAFNADVFSWARERLIATVGRLTAWRGDSANPSRKASFEARAVPHDRARVFHWVVVDEVGPLELRGEGLEPAVSAVVRTVRDRFTVPARQPDEPGDQIAPAAHRINAGTELRVVLVIREELAEEALAYLGVDAYQLF